MSQSHISITTQRHSIEIHDWTWFQHTQTDTPMNMKKWHVLLAGFKVFLAVVQIYRSTIPYFLRIYSLGTKYTLVKTKQIIKLVSFVTGFESSHNIYYSKRKRFQVQFQFWFFRKVNLFRNKFLKVDSVSAYRFTADSRVSFDKTNKK